MRIIAALSFLLLLGLWVAGCMTAARPIDAKNIILYGEISSAQRDAIVQYLRQKKLLKKDRIQFIRKVGPEAYEIRTDQKTIGLERKNGAWDVNVALWQSSTTMTITPDGQTHMNEELKTPHKEP